MIFTIAPKNDNNYNIIQQIARAFLHCVHSWTTLYKCPHDVAHLSEGILLTSSYAVHNTHASTLIIIIQKHLLDVMDI